MTSFPPTPESLDPGTQHRHGSPDLSPMRSPRTRSPATARRLQITNRRRRYLELHPEYFDSPSLELADPLAYDRLIRRFQSTDEREKEGRKKGYAGLLEADLWRQEAKSAAHVVKADCDYAGENRTGAAEQELVEGELEDAELPDNREQGAMNWRSKVEKRFMEGADADFDYESVDNRDEFDDWELEGREEEERWYDQEEATWANDTWEDEVDVEREHRREESLSGQTGIQDF